MVVGTTGGGIADGVRAFVVVVVAVVACFLI